MLGFPDRFTEVGAVTRTQRLRMLGNAVQVQAGELVGLAVRTYLEDE
jgi:site-specific DNA-cytosine methylase